MPTAIKSFQIVTGPEYVTIRLNGICDPNNLRPFLDEMKPYLEQAVPFIIVNCEHLLDISSEWIRQLIKIQVVLKQFDKAMRFILVNSKVMSLFKNEGVDSAFKFCKTLKEALVDFGLVKDKTLDTNFVNPFLTAALHVLKVQASVEAQAGKIYIKKANDTLLGDVSGVIGIVSDAFEGSVVISFPEQTFLSVMSGMLGETYTVVNKEILDGAGEITNMIFGQAKIVLNEQGYGIKSALPSVVNGRNHTVTGMTKGPVVVVPFTSSAGEFFVEICLSK